MKETIQDELVQIKEKCPKRNLNMTRMQITLLTSISIGIFQFSPSDEL